MFRKLKKPTMTLNVVLSMLNTMSTMAFSLVTYPYVARVLQVESLGKVTYSASIVNYFALLAALGYNTYAVREGSRLRNNKTALEFFLSQIFSLYLITLLITLFLLACAVVFCSNFKQYWLLIFIQSFTMVSAWIGVSWVNTIFEDYLCITVRSLAVHLLSLCLLFVFVKNPDDYYTYAAINVLASLLMSIINYVYSRKYCKISLVSISNINFKKDLPPALIFFSNSLAVSIYANSDTTMIGWMLGDYYVGLYSSAVKIYSLIKSLLAVSYNVAVARMSLYATEKDPQLFNTSLNKIINAIVFISIPTTVGLMIVAERVVLLLFGESYLDSVVPLRILSVAFLFAVLGGAVAYCVDIPLKREKQVLTATIVSAVENILLNLLLIPLYGITGAAITTLLAEITVFILLLLGLRDRLCLFNWGKIRINFLKSLLGVLLFYPVDIFINKLQMGNFPSLLLYVIIAGGTYLIVEKAVQNSSIIALAK